MEVNTIKIKLTTCATWRYQGKMYPGYSIVDIDPKYFDASFMVKIEETKPVETPITEVVTVAPEEPILPHVEVPPPEETKPKPRRIKKAD